MNATTPTTLPGTEVAAFAAAVRAALADLPPDEIDDLTDGLEADLTERLEEAPDAAAASLGDPHAYAEELRAAAGYPPRAARTHLGGRGLVPSVAGLRATAESARDDWLAFVGRHRPVKEVVGFLVALRPVWWVFRGWVVGFWASNAIFSGWAPLPSSTLGWALLLACVVVSVQFGRGRWLPYRWLRVAFLGVNIIVICATPVVLTWVGQQVNNMGYAYYYGAGETYVPESLNQGGNQIDNIYAYDAAGEPIDQVQLFDQDGNPLNLIGDTSSDFWGTMDGSMVVPSGDVPGRAGWNVYPLAHANSWSDYEDDGRIDESEISPAQFPSAHVKPLAGYLADADAAEDAGTAGDDVVAQPEPTPVP